MKFSVSQSSLLRALSVVSKGMGSTTLPLLSGIYIKAEEGTLEFQTNSLTISIRHRIPAHVEEGGETVVSGKVLTNIVKTLDDAPVTFDGGERMVAISCEKSSFRLNTLNPADWSPFPEVTTEQSIELPSSLLTEMVEKVYRVTSKETTRQILQGVLLTVEDNTVRLVATDSYRLAVCDSSAESPAGEEFRAIVPGATFHDVLSISSPNDNIAIGITDNQVVFSFGETTFISKKIEGNFPNYKQLLPASCATSVRIDVEAFAAALKRVSVIAQANSSVRFDIDAEGKTMKLSASSPDQGESSEVLPVDVDGESMAIALNYHYVFDCVNAADRKEVLLELQSNMQPGVFKTNGKINYLYLLMPVRM